MSNEVALRESTTPATNGGTPFSMTPRSLDEAMRFADIMAGSDLVPQGYKGKPGNILVAIQKGFEIGMTPMNALESIAVINGRATLWGDGMLALVQASPVYEWIDESGSTDTKGVCTVKRKGHKEHTAVFTLEDAKRAALLGKQGPWQMHTGRMLKLRARGFALRDVFADVLKGMISAEEALDLPVDAVPPPADAPAKPATLKEKLKRKVSEPTEKAAPPESTAPFVEPEAPPAQAGSGPSEGAAPTPDEIQAMLQGVQHKMSTASEQECHKLYGEAFNSGLYSREDMQGLRVLRDDRLKALTKK